MCLYSTHPTRETRATSSTTAAAWLSFLVPGASDSSFPDWACPSRFWCSSKVHNPIRFPRGAGIARIGLLPLTGCRRDLRPYETYSDGLPVQCVIPIEGTHAVIKTPAYRWIQGPLGKATIEPPDGPLLRLCIKRSQGRSITS